ncbi:SPOR domain-containing protein [Bradyrhizobium sp. U87765 SZCCT0131]|uniref:SPOR domain-containing protein n=1 Tax=unclassified Bradyrhizobium TaxID=2631580 RepID=UPI001BA89276|nr:MULTISPECIES: SPOR domain-containing protein [unclassified Bradyrhizobium]MBR1220087.1 SPOR domain-containing protein [Bradyrhizobium sp. U87765 SZCCT0131]MBR1263457.1 SPOR domain-containing protein [Bradyrhizobium sp. U87765 SZCCT0134]MBR1309026.1 SPOR domain-containing protein [Bradyrhizobium sp. U87765 SZCCT0110]MBR1323789.1 SPOR domain-containing protein [Bradyrhizobium sp. U87765 SZCCT0109]MBR1349341.1 SPOR domain-containing protein [Bradyrhizobium sp. U87765 SZCCT0048]
MADRYQGNRSYRADDGYDRARNQAAPQAAESDPLAELARLIGQTDPFSTFARDGRAAAAQPAAGYEDQQHDEAHEERSADFDVRPGRPSWMQRVAQRDVHHSDEHDDRAPAVQPHVDPYAQAQTQAANPYPAHYQQGDGYPQDDGYQQVAPHQGYAAADHGHQGYDGQVDPSRYDDVLYGPGDDQQAQHDGPDGGYADDGYGQGYDEETPTPVKRRGGLVTVVVVAALGIVGTAAAYAYRTYSGSPRSGEVPIIKADTSPNKIVPPAQQAADSASKPIQDRIGGAPGTERIVSREEQPVDVNAAKATGPRVVFPALTQNPNPNPAGASSPAMPPARPAAGPASGSLAGDEPRKVRTLSIRPDQPDSGAPPRPAPTRAAAPAPVSAPAAANAPMALTPQAPTRTASNAVASTGSTGLSGGYVVQISSQRSEADAQASYRALQTKFPNVLGSRAPLIKRADLGDKGVYYRAMVGPFGSSDEAGQFCGSLKSAGGQCVVQRN